MENKDSFIYIFALETYYLLLHATCLPFGSSSKFTLPVLFKIAFR